MYSTFDPQTVDIHTLWRLRLAGLGLVAYALGLATDVLAGHTPAPAAALNLARLGWPLLFLPALFWSGATAHLVPERAREQRVAARCSVWYNLAGCALDVTWKGVEESDAQAHD